MLLQQASLLCSNNGGNDGVAITRICSHSCGRVFARCKDRGVGELNCMNGRKSAWLLRK
jgi:hypothetical protein